MRDANERSAEAGRGPQGPRGLKWDVTQLEPLEALGRGPQGPRGLKLLRELGEAGEIWSRSARTARIEMSR